MRRALSAGRRWRISSRRCSTKIPGLSVCDREVLAASGDEEIDVLAINRGDDDGLHGFPHDVLIECKSQGGPVELPIGGGGLPYSCAAAT